MTEAIIQFGRLGKTHETILKQIKSHFPLGRNRGDTGDCYHSLYPQYEVLS